MWNKTIQLTPNWAKQFGITPEKDKEGKSFEISVKSVKKYKNTVSIEIEFSDGEKRPTISKIIPAIWLNFIFERSPFVSFGSLSNRSGCFCFVIDFFLFFPLLRL